MHDHPLLNDPLEVDRNHQLSNSFRKSLLCGGQSCRSLVVLQLSDLVRSRFLQLEGLLQPLRPVSTFSRHLWLFSDSYDTAEFVKYDPDVCDFAWNGKVLFTGSYRIR